MYSLLSVGTGVDAGDVTRRRPEFIFACQWIASNDPRIIERSIQWLRQPKCEQFPLLPNTLLGRLRKRKVRQRHEEPVLPQFNERESLIETVADFRPQSESIALNQELKVAIEKASQSLSSEYREVFLLRDIEGLSYEEVSTLTGLTLANVKTRLHRARLAMRRALNEYYEEKSA